MRLGLLTARVPVAQSAELARLAEDRGLDSVWVAEDLWHRGAMPVATACALATERIRVGIGLANPYGQHPTQIAMNYGALAELSGGRAVLALGASVRRWVEQMGYEQRRPRTRVAEAIAIVRELLRDGASSYSGAEFGIDDVELGFAVEDPAPLFMGAIGARSVRTAGAVADGWLVSVLLPAAYTRAGRAWLEDGALQAGRDPQAIEVVQYVPFCCDEDAAAARAAAKELVALFMAGDLDLFRSQPPVLAALSGHLESTTPAEYDRTVERLRGGVAASDAISDDLLDEVAVCGDAPACAASLRRFAEAGVTEAVMLPAGDAVAAVAALGGPIRHALDGAGEPA